jgi:hypothetical protein
MSRDIPFVGVTFSPEVKPNSDWYLRSVIKSNASTPTDATPAYLFSDITDRTYSFSTRRGSTYELGRVEAGECELGVDNSDGLFDPNNSSSAYYPNVKPYRPLRINCAYPTTGNILNDTNLAAPVPSDAPDTYANDKISVGANDGNFELGAISNWWTSGTATITTSTTTPFAGTRKAVITSNNNGSYAFLDVPVVAGKQITVSLYYTSTANAQFAVFDGGIGSNVVSFTTLTTTGTYVRASRTLTPESPKITIRIGWSSVTTIVSIDNVQVEFGATPSTYTTTGPTIYNLFNGFVERYPQTYQAPNRGQVNMMATDSIASLSQNQLLSPYEALIVQDKALYYYPFSEEADSVIAVNKGLYAQDSMYKRTLGTPTDVTFGTTSAVEGIPNVGTTNVAINNSLIAGKPGTFLTLENVENIDLRSGKTYTFSFWCQFPDYISDPKIVFQAHLKPQWDGSLQGIYFSVDPDFTELSLYDAQQNDLGPVVEGNNATDNWLLYAVEIRFESGFDPNYGDYIVRIRSPKVPDSIPVAIGSGFGDLYIPFQSFSFFGFNTTSANTIQQNFAHFAVHEGVIDFDAYYQAGIGLFGDTTGKRFSDFVNKYSGMSYLPYAADTGKSAMQYAKTYGTTLGDYIQKINDTEGGYWFTDGEGFVTFKDRWNRLQKLEPSVTFGDGAGEIPFAGDELVINYDPTYVLNDIAINQIDGVTAFAQDTDSVADYFPRSYSRETENVSELQTIDMANFLLSRYKQPNARPEVITLTPARNPAIWPTVLGLEIGDYVRVNRRPLGAPAISVDCFIEAIAHEFDGQTGDWITRVTVSPAIAEYWNLSTIQAVTRGNAGPGTLVLDKGWRINLVRNPSFETNTASWLAKGTNATITRASTTPFSGSWVASVYKEFSNTGIEWSGTNIIVTPGLPYTLSAYVRVPSGQPSCSLRFTVNQFRAGGTSNPTFFSTPVTVTSANGWVRLSITFTPITGANPTTSMDFSIDEMQFDAFNRTFLVDAVLLEQSATLNPYFDGNSPDGAWEGTVNNTASFIVGNTNISRESFYAGQMLQYTIGETTYVDVVTEPINDNSGSNLVLSVSRIGTITKSENTITSDTLTTLIPVDWVHNFFDDFGELKFPNAFTGAGFTKFLINGELIGGIVNGAQLEATARNIDGTNQAIQGSTTGLNDDLSESHTVSHFAGSTIYGVSTTPTATIPDGTIITEYLDNQVTRLPYEPFNYSNLDPASTLGSWTNTLNTGTIVTETPVSGIKYNTITLDPLTDESSYPSSDIATGQIFSIYRGFVAIESFAVAAVSAPASDGTWTMTGYEVLDNGAILRFDLGVDFTQVNANQIITASAILINNEFMQVTAGSGTTTLQVVRGTPDADVWSVLSKAQHYKYDKIYTIVNAGLTFTYAAGNPVIEGYNVSTPIIGTTRLGY